MPQRTITYLPELYDLIKNIPATLLYCQIRWHFTNAEHSLHVERQGKRWLVKSHREWWTETRLGRRQLDRALLHLQKMGLIGTRVMRHRGTPIRHVCLIAPNGANDCTKGCNVIAPNGANLYGETKEETKSLQKGGKFLLKAAEEGGKVKIKKGSKSGEVVKVLQENSYIPSDVEKISSGALATWWTKIFKVHYAYHGPLTQKQKGQLGNFIRKVPPGSAYRVMRYALEHWEELKIDIQHKKGATIAAEPTVSALLLHADTAVRLEAEAALKLTSNDNKVSGPKKLDTIFVVE